MKDIATTQTSWNPARTRLMAVPRTTFTRLDRGTTLGRPNDTTQQRRVLEATLALLSQDAPIKPVYLKEKTE